MEEDPGHLGQKRTVDLDRGIFIVRYSSAEDEAFPPIVKVSIAAGSNEAISAVLHPDEREAVLWQPGAGLVVQALDVGQLLVEVSPVRPKGSAAATVRIETLTQGKAAIEVVTANDGQAEETVAPVEQITRDFRVLGHVAGRGDVFVNANEWIGGPTAPSRIEGIAVEWPSKPRDLTIRYAVKTAQANARSEAPVGLGAFAGTRGRALPLVGVLAELSGTGASDFELAVDAVFLGSPAMSAKGQRVAVAGPTGGEPLVGLRLRIERPQKAPAPVRTPKIQAPGRVRVFRSTGTKGG